MKRIRPGLIYSGHVITRSYSGVVIQHIYTTPRRYSWGLEDRLIGCLLEVSSHRYTTPTQARRRLYQVAQRLQDRRDTKRERGGEE